MLFALGFLPMFGIGGLTGLPLGFNASDIQLHDTYYVIAHFHYMVAPGTIFALFAGIYYWYPKMTGRFMNEFWGKVHFALSFIFMNLIFMPMFIQGMAGMSRRMYDGGATYAETRRTSCGLSPFIIGLEQRHFPCRLVPGPGANSVHHQFLLEHQTRQKSHFGQSVGRHHPGMADAHSAAARQFRQADRGFPRPLRIQRARPRARFHPAKRAGHNQNL